MEKTLNRTFKYIYTDPNGRQITLKKAITDKMAADVDKKNCAADWFRQMLEHSGYKDPDIVVRNIQEG